MCRILAYLGEPMAVAGPAARHRQQPGATVVWPADDEHVPQPRRGSGVRRPGIRAGSRPTIRSPTGRPPCRRSTATCASWRRSSRPRAMIAHVRGVARSGEGVVADANLHPFHFAGARIILAHDGHLQQFRACATRSSSTWTACARAAHRGDRRLRVDLRADPVRLDDPFGAPESRGSSAMPPRARSASCAMSARA